MKIRETISTALALTAFIVIFGVCCWPTVCGIRVLGWIRRSPEQLIRSRVARCAHWWGSIVFCLIIQLLRLEVELLIKGQYNLLHHRSCIVISNHQSTLDIAVLTWLAHHLGLGNTRWILKDTLKNAPVIGWIAQRTGCAFVSRQKDPKDVDALKQCASILREDQASIILFPEGTRFTKDKASTKFNHVLSPKQTGFKLLHEALQDAPIVTVTLQWTPAVADGSRGKTIYQGADFYKKSLRIAIRIVPYEEVRNDPNWLEHDWEAKDRLLAPYDHTGT